MEFKRLPLWAARVAQSEQEASRLKGIYQREGARVRVFPRHVRAGGADLWFFAVVARKPERTTADEKTAD